MQTVCCIKCKTLFSEKKKIKKKVADHHFVIYWIYQESPKAADI